LHYRIRHRYGTRLFRDVGIEYARGLLGHANTTQSCMHLDERELADAQELVE